MKKKHIITIVLLSVAILVNIGLAIIFHGDSGANIFTAISGWISGVATIALGVIALVVNEKYKKENDDFILKQEELFWKEEKKTAIEVYREQIIKCHDDFLKYHYADVLSSMFADENKPESPIYNLARLSKIRSEKSNMFFELGICRYYINFKSELLESYGRYLLLLEKMIRSYNEIVEKRNYETIVELEKTYIEVINNFNIHIAEINLFLSVTLPNKKKSELEGIMKDMIEKENEWWAKLEPKKEDNKICNSDENKE